MVADDVHVFGDGSTHKGNDIYERLLSAIHNENTLKLYANLGRRLGRLLDLRGQVVRPRELHAQGRPRPLDRAQRDRRGHPRAAGAAPPRAEAPVAGPRPAVPPGWQLDREESTAPRLRYRSAWPRALRRSADGVVAMDRLGAANGRVDRIAIEMDRGGSTRGAPA